MNEVMNSEVIVSQEIDIVKVLMIVKTVKEQNWWNSQIWIGTICMLEVLHNDQ